MSTRSMVGGLAKQPQELWAGEVYVAIFDSEDEIRQIQPNYHLLSQLDRLGVAITAKAKLTAIQASQRGGKLWGEIKNNRVFLTGYTKKYMEAELHL